MGKFLEAVKRHFKIHKIKIIPTNQTKKKSFHFQIKGERARIDSSEKLKPRNFFEMISSTEIIEVNPVSKYLLN